MQTTEREEVRIFEYLEENASDRDLESPLKILTEFLLSNFGWPRTTGRKKALTVLKKLEDAGLVRCKYNKRNSLKSLRFVKLAPDLREPPRLNVVPQKTPIAAIPQTSQANSENERRRMAEQLRNEWLASKRNENRCFRLTESMLAILGELFPQNRLPHFTSLRCSKSGNHNPRKGIVDIADSRGEDVGIELTALFKDGSSLASRIMIDVKNHERGAQRFNRNIIFKAYEIEKNVGFKTAICVNYFMEDWEVIAAVLDSIAETGFDFVNSRRDEILSRFRQ